MNIDIEEEENTCFNPATWIATGKLWKDPPLYVINARNVTLRLPLAATKKLPSEDLPIMKFLNFELPIQSFSLSTHPDSSWFSADPPDISEEQCIGMLFRRPIPSADLLRELKEIYGQMWLDGTKSISDPRYNRGKDRFPLWALELWRQLAVIVNDKTHWAEAHETLRQLVFSNPAVSERFKTTASVFGQRTWNGDFLIGRFTFSTSTFSALLQRSMINDDVAQAMTQVLQTRLETNAIIRKAHYIAASRFSSVLRVAVERKKLKDSENLPRSLQDVEDLVEANPNIHVWFPALLNSHEVAICVDFGKRTLAYGTLVTEQT